MLKCNSCITSSIKTNLLMKVFEAFSLSSRSSIKLDLEPWFFITYIKDESFGSLTCHAILKNLYTQSICVAEAWSCLCRVYAFAEVEFEHESFFLTILTLSHFPLNNESLSWSIWTNIIFITNFPSIKQSYLRTTNAYV